VNRDDRTEGPPFIYSTRKRKHDKTLKKGEKNTLKERDDKSPHSGKFGLKKRCPWEGTLKKGIGGVVHIGTRTIKICVLNRHLNSLELLEKGLERGKVTLTQGVFDVGFLLGGAFRRVEGEKGKEKKPKKIGSGPRGKLSSGGQSHG